MRVFSFFGCTFYCELCRRLRTVVKKIAFFLFDGSMQTQSLFFLHFSWAAHKHTKAFTVFSHLIRLLRWFFGLTRKILWLLNIVAELFFSFALVQSKGAHRVLCCFSTLFVNRLFSHANCVKEMKPKIKYRLVIDFFVALKHTRRCDLVAAEFWLRCQNVPTLDAYTSIVRLKEKWFDDSNLAPWAPFN